ncbi:MAG: cysteine--tRNA ligase [Deltaproteobacteria bacterium]|nr:cysteine--tRNA ligase [Deltaproteobacteria bacterium]
MTKIAAKITNRKAEFLLTNTLTGKREPFKTQVPGKVLFYTCGPTVYGPLHIGNMRALVVGDLIFRWLKHLGFDVNFVRNYTDVDDKIINRANEEKISALEVAQKYIDYCDTDMKLLGLQAPTKTVRVTDSMDDILKIIEKIIANGKAYVVDGEVLFSIEGFPGYGKLSGKNVEDLVAGSRVEVDKKKKNPADFSLWKPAKPGEPFWESPWGKGRPGWHIECSAMVSHWLGETIDLHHGGQDLIFPHHENEIAQSEAATGKPFCNHWVHHAFITAGNEKMSKSLGNILPTRKFIEIYGAELLRFIFVSFQYRSELPYTQPMLAQSMGELERIYLAKKWARQAASEPVSHDGKGATWSALIGKAREVFSKMEEELLSDLNTPGALGHLFSYIRELNRVEGEASGRAGAHPASSAERKEVAREFLHLLETQINPLLNVFAEEPQAMLDKLESIRRSKQSSSLSDDEIKAMIQARLDARKMKDFKKADDIRQALDAQGIVLLDSPQGTTWKAKG